MTVLIGILIYFGALIIPVVYLLPTHAREGVRALILHLIESCA
jgi:hypothetical protein